MAQSGNNGVRETAARGAGRSRFALTMPEAPRWLTRWLGARPPGVAIAFGRDRFVVAQVHRPTRRGSLPRLLHAAAHDLPPGSLEPSLLEPNLRTPADVAARLGRALQALPQRRRLQRVALVLPDSCARVTLLTLRDLPRSERQAAEVIRWQIRKRVPFRLDQARLSWQRFALGDGSERVVVALGLESVLAPYEQLAESLGLHPGLVDLATFNLAGLPPVPPGTGDAALVNATAEEISLLIERRGTPLFYRSRPWTAAEAGGGDVRRTLLRELVSSVAYYRDRLADGGGSLATVRLRAADGLHEPLLSAAREALGVEPVPVSVAAAVAAPAGLSAGALELAAPAIGLMIGRVAA